MIAECKHPAAVSICMILIENGVDFDALDSFSNNGNFHSLNTSSKYFAVIYAFECSFAYRSSIQQFTSLESTLIQFKY